jgi:hypothetical protein
MQVAHYINYKNETPVIGMGVTIFHYTDRSAGTIVKISKSGKTIWFSEDKAIRTDSNGMSECQTYEYKFDKAAAEGKKMKGMEPKK